MRREDLQGGFGAFLDLPLPADERSLGSIEGWILGVK
jgi:hypothetical protein